MGFWGANIFDFWQHGKNGMFDFRKFNSVTKVFDHGVHTAFEVVVALIVQIARFLLVIEILRRAVVIVVIVVITAPNMTILI